MIIWLASYPKSGNTWLRSLIASYFYSNNGSFNFKLLDNIDQFPSPQFFKNYEDPLSEPEATSNFWINEQEKINKEKKIRFLKTHNALCKINSNSFTDEKNTIGAIYIVRDPRNLITSLAHHYQIDQNEAFNFMVNKKKALIEKSNNKFVGFVPILSWDLHLESWINCKKFPILVIRYEDLLTSAFDTFKKVISFINKLSPISNKLDEIKISQSINSCSFDKLEKLEKNNGFHEAMENKNNNKKIKFFNLGKDNNYKKLLEPKLTKKITDLYKSQIEKFNYE